MATAYSPKIITDGLVFMYDTDDGKSYKGEPTENLTSDSPSQNGWNGTFSVEESASKTFTITTQQKNAATTSAWRTWYWSVSPHIGSYVTISADVEFVSETDCTFRDITIGQGNTGSFPYHITGSGAADRVIVSTKPTTQIRMEWSGIINATGIVGFTQWINNVTTNGANSVLRLTNVQIEVKSHATPFVNGTRSATQGLIDRTGNSTIDLSPASYDSNAQITFDGTDDYITLGSDSVLQDIGSHATIECWFKSSATGSKFALMVGWGDGTSYYSNFGIGNWYSAQSDESIYVGVNSAAVVYAENGGSTKYHDGNWHHAVALMGHNNHKIYVDGSEVSVSFPYCSNSVSTSKLFGFTSGTEVI